MLINKGLRFCLRGTCFMAFPGKVVLKLQKGIDK